MKFKKRILSMVLSCLMLISLFSVPVMAAEPALPVSEASVATAVPSDAIFAGTINRAGGSVSLGRITLFDDTALVVYLPTNGNLDLFQGEITFRSPSGVITRQFTNMSKDAWYFYGSDIGAGIWTVTISGYAIGTSQKQQIYYKTVSDF